MSIEKALADLTAAVEANTAAVLGKGGTAATTDKPAKATADKPAKATTKKPASEHTREEMQAALAELKKEKGAPVAKEVISEHGGVEKMAEIPDDKIDAVYEAAVAAKEADDDTM